MKQMRNVAVWAGYTVAVGALVALIAQMAWPHCDTLDGPVVAQARAAFEKGGVTPVLKWVRPEQEGEVRAAFARSLAVRGKGPEARELADMYFFETLVRLHRAGEGAPYLGLKPAGTELEPGVAEADGALESGSSDALVREVTGHVADGIRKRFEEVVEKKKRTDDSVEAGRAYVAAYVDYAHFVEGVVAAASTGPHHAEGAAKEPETGAHEHPTREAE